MFVIIQIVFIVYILSINVYGFILVKIRKNDESISECKPNNSKLIICALLGGAIGTYVAMFIFKYNLDSLILMVFLPVIACLNIFIVWLLYKYNFGFEIDYLLQNIFNYAINIKW